MKKKKTTNNLHTLTHNSNGPQITGYQTIHIVVESKERSSGKKKIPTTNQCTRPHELFSQMFENFLRVDSMKFSVLVKCTMFRNELKIFSSCASIFIQLFCVEIHTAKRVLSAVCLCVYVCRLCALPKHQHAPTTVNFFHSSLFPNPCHAWLTLWMGCFLTVCSGNTLKHTQLHDGDYQASKYL